MDRETTETLTGCMRNRNLTRSIHESAGSAPIGLADSLDHRSAKRAPGDGAFPSAAKSPRRHSSGAGGLRNSPSCFYWLRTVLGLLPPPSALLGASRWGPSRRRPGRAAATSCAPDPLARSVNQFGGSLASECSALLDATIPFPSPHQFKGACNLLLTICRIPETNVGVRKKVPNIVWRFAADGTSPDAFAKDDRLSFELG